MPKLSLKIVKSDDIHITSLFERLKLLPSELINGVIDRLPCEYIYTLYIIFKEDPRVKMHLSKYLYWQIKDINYWIYLNNVEAVSWLVGKCGKKVYKDNLKYLYTKHEYLSIDPSPIDYVFVENALTNCDINAVCDINVVCDICKLGVPVSEILRFYSENCCTPIVDLDFIKYISSFVGDISCDIHLLRYHEAIKYEDRKDFYDWLIDIGGSYIRRAIIFSPKYSDSCYLERLYNGKDISSKEFISLCSKYERYDLIEKYILDFQLSDVEIYRHMTTDIYSLKSIQYTYSNISWGFLRGLDIRCGIRYMITSGNVDDLNSLRRDGINIFYENVDLDAVKSLDISLLFYMLDAGVEFNNSRYIDFLNHKSNMTNPTKILDEDDGPASLYAVYAWLNIYGKGELNCYITGLFSIGKYRCHDEFIKLWEKEFINYNGEITDIFYYMIWNKFSFIDE